MSPDGHRLYSASHDATIGVWSPKGECVRRVGEHSSVVRWLDLSPDGQTLASCGDDATVRLYDAITGDIQLTLRGHTKPVRAVGFRGDLLVSAGHGPEILTWATSPAPETPDPQAP